jgi:flagellar assembly factor FliW
VEVKIMKLMSVHEHKLIVQHHNQANDASDAKVQFIESRFGQIKINIEKAILFPKGLLGIPDYNTYCLAHFPNPAFQRFKILQSVEKKDLAFIVLPLDEMELKYSAQFIDREDLRECSTALNIPEGNMVVLLITTIYHVPDVGGKLKTQICVNLRAPLILDIQKYLGAQHVFHKEKYEIRHEIT